MTDGRTDGQTDDGQSQLLNPACAYAARGNYAARGMSLLETSSYSLYLLFTIQKGCFFSSKFEANNYDVRCGNDDFTNLIHNLYLGHTKLI